MYKKVLFFISTLLPALLAFILGAAHFWRAGMYGLSLTSLGCGLLACLCRHAFVRLICMGLLLLLSLRWIWVTSVLVQLRMQLEQPWIRLSCILLGVALFTLLAAWLLHRKKAKEFFSRKRQTALQSSVSFYLVFFSFLLIDTIATHVLILHRFFPGFGVFQGFLCSLWAAFMLEALTDPQKTVRTRLFLWRLFSIVFFTQLFLGLLGYTVFLMGENLHLPVPGLIIAAPIFRGEGFFMLILFTVSLLLTGSAWCSHLCYFGVWDAILAAKRKNSAKKAPPLPPLLRKVLLWSAPCLCVLTVGTAFLLHILNVEGNLVPLALSLGLLLGLLLFPAMLLITRVYGVNGYCVGICPLGVLATRGKALMPWIYPWRISFSSTCTQCGKCLRACTSLALDATAIKAQRVGATCTLCGNCVAVCPHKGCHVDFTWYKLSPSLSSSIFHVLIISIHALFLGVAMV